MQAETVWKSKNPSAMRVNLIFRAYILIPITSLHFGGMHSSMYSAHGYPVTSWMPVRMTFPLSSLSRIYPLRGRGSSPNAPPRSSDRSLRLDHTLRRGKPLIAFACIPAAFHGLPRLFDEVIRKLRMVSTSVQGFDGYIALSFFAEYLFPNFRDHLQVDCRQNDMMVYVGHAFGLRAGNHTSHATPCFLHSARIRRIKACLSASACSSAVFLS